MHSLADLVEVMRPNGELRDESRVECKYFGSCAGCQYQMVSYETQLGLKRDVVVKAFKNFSGEFVHLMRSGRLLKGVSRPARIVPPRDRVDDRITAAIRISH